MLSSTRSRVRNARRFIQWVEGACPSWRYRALDRAEKALTADLPKYLPLWENAVPAEFKERKWDYSRFTRGERFVYEPLPRREFDEVFEQVERWGLDQHLKERSFEKLIYSTAADAR